MIMMRVQSMSQGRHKEMSIVRVMVVLMKRSKVVAIISECGLLAEHRRVGFNLIVFEKVD